MKHLRWDREAPAPRHPYRDTAFLYAVFAGIIVLVTAVTSGNLLPGDSNRRHGVLRFVAEIGAVPVAAAFFVVATGFSWWRWWAKHRATEAPEP